MDAIVDPHIETVVFMKSSQVGATEILNNAVGYYIDQDPAPILCVQPTVNDGKTWSKDRLNTMLRDTKCLHGKVKDAKSRDSNNTTLHKVFPGGHITITGANAPSGLAARPIRVLLCDEVDRYPASAGIEGDPVNLAIKRTTTFWNRKIILTSTPTVRGVSRIEMAYNESDKRRYYVPCPHCEYMQVLKWGNVKWPEGEPSKAYYECEHCKRIITDAEKFWMLRRGEWRAEAETKGIAGFHLNEIYSPWVSFATMARNFLEAKKSPETLKTWVNTALGETWEEVGETIDEHALQLRAESYGPEVPLGAGILTAGIDVQIDRLECEVVAWGRGEESWSMDYAVFAGDPLQAQVWRDLDAYLMRLWPHESGEQMPISCTLIDSGFKPREVLDFTRPRRSRGIYASKGENIPGKPIIDLERKHILKHKTIRVGVDAAKSTIYGFLRIEEPGPGYMHFPISKAHNKEYFEQLTAEKIVTKYHRGFPRRVWHKIKNRNEALDCRVLAMAALRLFVGKKNINQFLDDRVSYFEIIAAKKKPESNRVTNAAPIFPVRGRRILNKGIDLSWRG